MKSSLLITLLFIGILASAQEYNYLLNTDGLAQADNGLFIDDAGICYEKTLLLASYGEIEKVRNKYSNKNITTTTETLGNLKFTLAGRQQGWVKQKARNCLSADPEDCLVWCKVDMPRRIVDIHVIDPEGSFPISLLPADITTMMEGNYLVYSAIDCKPDSSTTVKSHEVLDTYFEGELVDKSFTERLHIYQYEQQLPIGSLNYETLFSLGLKD